jgi:phenylalanyl-tRNA synthetase alpha chain
VAGDPRVQQIHDRALAEIAGARSTSDLESLRVRVLGRSGELTALLRSLGSLPAAERPKVGQQANEVKQALEAALAERLEAVKGDERRRAREAERLDLTLPGRFTLPGPAHPLTRVLEEIIQIFEGLGFSVAEGPEVETDYYNFTALNIPPEHPARSEHDTFFLDEGLILRTHTSPVQIRAMLSQEPPVYVVCPGRTYRRDSDPTHTPMFHQIEGLAVDRGLTLGHLKGTLAAMARHVFGEGLKVRLRPGYFQFTEPSVEMDLSCFVCGGSDPNCKVCKGAGWLEMLGAGMVDPAVLEEVGYDPEEYTAFAFGMGPDRMAMVKYGIPDLRLFFEGDLRFLRQF